MKIPLRMWSFLPFDSNDLTEFVLKRLGSLAPPPGVLEHALQAYAEQAHNKLNFETPDTKEALAGRLACFRLVSSGLNEGHAVKLEFAGQDVIAVDEEATTPGGPALRVAEDVETVTDGLVVGSDIVADVTGREFKGGVLRYFQAPGETDGDFRARVACETGYVPGKWQDPCPPALRVRPREPGDVCDEDCKPGTGICRAFTDCKNRGEIIAAVRKAEAEEG